VSDNADLSVELEKIYDSDSLTVSQPAYNRFQ